MKIVWPKQKVADFWFRSTLKLTLFARPAMEFGWLHVKIRLIIEIVRPI